MTPKPKLRTLSDIPIFDDENYGLIDDIRQAAQEVIKAVQSGKCDWEFDIIPEDQRGSIAKDNWHDGIFTLGMEYGLIWGFKHFFNLK